MEAMKQSWTDDDWTPSGAIRSGASTSDSLQRTMLQFSGALIVALVGFMITQV
jgi:hypothetical protein